MDKLSAMAAFTQAVEQGSFTAAGNAIGISQQMVAKHVSNLEAMLGATLLRRTTRNHTLTEFGEQYYVRCRRILEDVKQAERLSDVSTSSPRGRLKISAPRAFGAFSLTDFLVSFMRQYPDIYVDLHLADEIVDLYAGGYDFVFRVGKLGDSNLIARKLVDYKLVCCASPSYLIKHGEPKKPADLLDHQCLGHIMTTYSECNNWFFYHQDTKIKIPIEPKLKVNESRSLVSCALRGFGIAMVPELIVVNEISQGKLIRVLPNFDTISRNFNLVYRQDNYKTATMRVFIDAILDNYR